MDVRVLGVLRTAFNVGEVSLLSATENAALDLSAKRLTSQGSFAVAYCQRQEASSELRYAHLDEDATPAFLTPFFLVTDLDGLAPTKLPYLSSVRDLELRIFDNTIAMIEFVATVDAGQVPADLTASDLEAAITRAAEELCRRMQAQVINPLCARTKRELGGSRRSTILRGPREALVFSARGTAPLQDWPDERNSLLWASRLYSDPNAFSEREKAVSRWNDIQGSDCPRLPFLHAHVGTSFLTDSTRLEAFRKAHRHAQLLYALFDLVQDRQLILDGAFVEGASARRLAYGAAALSQITAFLAQLKAEKSNAEIKLQGDRLLIFNTLNKTFSLNELVAAVQSRAEVLEKRLSLALQTKGVLQDALIQGILFAIGALQVIELFSTLHEYSITIAPQQNDPVLGATNLLSALSFNGAVNTLVLISVLVGFVLMAWRRR